MTLVTEHIQEFFIFRSNVIVTPLHWSITTYKFKQCNSFHGAIMPIIVIIIIMAIMPLSDRKTAVLNKAISPKLRVARFTSTLRQSYDLHEIHQTEKSSFVGAKVFHWEHALAYPNNIGKACGHPEAFTSTTIF